MSVTSKTTYEFPGDNVASTDLCRDPFSSLYAVMLIGASKEKGIKLSRVSGHFKPMFSHNSMLPGPIQQMSLSVHRTINGDSRSDLAYFDYAINAVSKLYPMAKAENNENMLKFWNLAKVGMQSMAFTYGQLEEKESDPVSFKKWEHKITEITSSTESADSEDARDIVQKVKALWSLLEIKEFNDGLDEIEKEPSQEARIAFIKVFETRLERKARDYIKIATSQLSLLP